MVEIEVRGDIESAIRFLKKAVQRDEGQGRGQGYPSGLSAAWEGKSFLGWSKDKIREFFRRKA